MGALRADDRDWRGGRVFSLVYSAGDEIHDLLERAADAYSAENAFNTMVFPSLGWMQNDIVTITTGLWAPTDPRDKGEGPGLPHVRRHRVLFLATKTARDWGRNPGRHSPPNMVLATSAHAAFEKASHYFDVESRRIARWPRLPR